MSIRIYTGGFAGPMAAGARVAKEIEAYAQEHNYTSHTIVSRSRKWFPSYYEYVVQFSRESVQPSPADDVPKAAPGE